MRLIKAIYTVSSEWVIPENLHLLSIEDNDKDENYEKPGFWWIKYDTLCYIDKDGKYQELEKDFAARDDDYKWADKIEDDDSKKHKKVANPTS